MPLGSILIQPAFEHAASKFDLDDWFIEDTDG